MTTTTTNLLTISLGAALGAYLFPLLSPSLPNLNLNPFSPPASSSPLLPSYTCPPHNYTTTLISLSPLLIHITNFIPHHEASHLIALSDPLLTPSPQHGSAATAQTRTSWSAPLPDSDPVTHCILSRASSFLGTLLSPGRDEIGPSQIVRYLPGQKFDPHTDWFPQPRVDEKDIETGRKRMYNRIATIFAVLQANHTGGGETWFPKVEAITPQERWEGNPEERIWRVHEEGGLAFKAVAGNALFWVNIGQNGAGDPKTVHAGLPVEGGVKYGMNIWPRVFFGPDA
ncbi:hypothetical protein QBC34DRAFT_487815 [Podospora aff. communis PSN243]|uniref:Prolyl 4-hydroxylase alpha subunit domain-containing protein n=1 Tax=Podospora aff. communis PSN243 TaxID=3040156 RepID=A0AAV9G7Q5_9PEZI|nr:hypothetical protein QBC34DRAFT_487815 [Podospora aff. communis PSN243]